jgi:hypothetical protein
MTIKVVSSKPYKYIQSKTYPHLILEDDVDAWWETDPDLDEDERELWRIISSVDPNDPNPCGWVTPQTLEKDGIVQVWYACSCGATGGEAIGPVGDYSRLLDQAWELFEH